MDGEKGNSGNGNDNDESNNCASMSLQMEPIKGAGLSNLPMDEGWVNPTGLAELWWPRDLTNLQIRPMLNVLFRNGMLSYVSAGLDVRVPHTTSDGDGEEEVTSWRNYGMNSQPIARQWTTLDIAMEKMFHVEGFVLLDNVDGSDDDEEKPQHTTLFPSLYTQEVMKRVATFIAEVDSLSPIAEGFHITSFPMMENWTDLPSPEVSKKVEESGEDEAMYKIVLFATSEPFGNKLLDMDEDILTMSSTSVLEVAVSRTARGGDSPYLTEPYKGLYLKT